MAPASMIGAGTGRSSNISISTREKGSKRSWTSWPGITILWHRKCLLRYHITPPQLSDVPRSKMYKVRIKQWGYSKNIRTTSEDVGSLMNIVSETKGPVLLATGRVVDSQRLALHLRRKKEGIVHTSQPVARTRWPPSPQLPSIRPPDVFYVSEAVLTHTRGYMWAQMIDADFVLGRTAHPDSKQVTDSMHLLRDLLRGDKVDEAVVLLKQVPGQINALLRHEPPQILNRIFLMVVHLLSVPGQQERVGGIIKALVNYAAAAATEPNLVRSRPSPFGGVITR